MNAGDTIAAISSAVGPAARMVLRASGPQSLAIARQLLGGSIPPTSAARNTIAFAGLRFPAWIYLFRSPRSFTGEDLVEFHVPGNPVLARMLLDELLRLGARLADAGEFTARAYFAGKIDLSEAEGIAATIAASNEREMRAARQLLSGELARRLRPAMDLIGRTLALVEVEIDFSEEDVSFLPLAEIHRRVAEIDALLENLLDQSTRFERLVHEPRIVLAGRPNAGKSTLVNALTGRRRSVVSDIAGTTRDALTAPLDLPHGKIWLVDVAGIETISAAHDSIESQMRARALQEVETAEHIVMVRDSTDGEPSPELGRAVDLSILSKADLLNGAATPLDPGMILVSAIAGTGMDELRAALDHLAFAQDDVGTGLALNRRHVTCIGEARAALARVPARIDEGAAELLALELREALDALGRVLGSVTPDDVLGQIFSSFCIGK